MRYVPDRERSLRMTPEELRDGYLVQDLFHDGKLTYVACDLDRVVLGGAVPTSDPIGLKTPPETGTDSLTTRREVGILNIGGAGRATVGGETYEMNPLDCLYVGRGAEGVRLESTSGSEPARFYLVSYPAHQSFPTRHVGKAATEPVELGSQAEANRRRLYKYVHPDGIPSSQLVMGITVLEEGSVWNTMPPHTHERRSEVYLYFGLREPHVVLHLMGAPEATRSLIVRNGQAVLSPPWSVHAGAGTGAYMFCWAMGGENQEFSDMQAAPLGTLA
jgi:4-deoxy-L-threo-5-hexosulose-uronate ketol-isomerase